MESNGIKRVVAELPGALLEPDEDDREGYVPNVAHSGGSLIHAGLRWMPYGAGGARVGFVTAEVAEVVSAMTPVRDVRSPGPE